MPVLPFSEVKVHQNVFPKAQGIPATATAEDVDLGL